MTVILSEAYQQTGIAELDVIVDASELWGQFCESNQPLFDRVVIAKPDQAIEYHLLGMLTKAQLEAQQALVQHQSSIAAMRDAFEQHLGAEHAGSFKLSGEGELRVMTHGWLYMQGYLLLDFSLANEHAAHVSDTLSSLSSGSSDAYRTQFMASYYQGRERARQQTKAVGWLEKLFFWRRK